MLTSISVHVPVVLSAIVLLLAVAALLLSNRKLSPTPQAGSSAQVTLITGVVDTLSFGSPAPVISREPKRSELEKTLQSFDHALASWLEAAPASYREVLVSEIGSVRRSLGKFTPHFIRGDPAHARQEAATIMRNAARRCLIASDQDLDKDGNNRLLQTPLEALIELAGLTLIDPAEGTMWPPSSSGARSRGKKVGRVNTRGLAVGKGIFLEPEIQETF